MFDWGVKVFEIKYVVIGYNVDDIVEIVFMNFLCGDVFWFLCSISIVIGDLFSDVKCSKLFKYVYEKEIVFYVYYKKFDYFSIECIYSFEVFWGMVWSLIKNLEKVWLSVILDIVWSGEDLVRLILDKGWGFCGCDENEGMSGCGLVVGSSMGGVLKEVVIVKIEVLIVSVFEIEVMLGDLKND